MYIHVYNKGYLRSFFAFSPIFFFFVIRRILSAILTSSYMYLHIFSIVASFSHLLPSYHVSIYIISPLLVVIRVASAVGTARNNCVEDGKDNNGRKGRHLEDEQCMIVK